MNTGAIVKFKGGPLAGQAEATDGANYDPLRSGGAMMAEMAYQDYKAHPPAPGTPLWVMCRVHEGRQAGPHFYKIVWGDDQGGTLKLVCEYGGTKYPMEAKAA